MAKKVRLKSGFTLGGQQAEADPLLTEAFYPSSDYQVISSKSDPRCFIVGRTGSGKSAALQHLEEEHGEHVIRINPEDLSLPYITETQVIRYLDELNVNLDLFWIALWKHVLLVEIIRHRYKVNSPAAKTKMMQALRDKLARDPGKKAALEYLDEFEGRFWCETDERVRDITDKFTKTIGGQIEATATSFGIPIGATLGSIRNESTEVKTQQAERFQRVVNATQLAKLNKMIEVLNEDVLDEQHQTWIVIDDLDRDWVDERLANDLIRCLFRTVLDLKRVANLKVLVALRTNIFQELDFGKRGGGQEEKFRSLVLTVRWTRYDLESLLDQRVQIAAPRVGLEASTLQDLLPHANRTRNPTDFIFERTLLRPRDAIAFMNECLARGIGKTRLTWDDITKAEGAYSSERLLALRDEWKSTYPGIDQALAKFRGCSARLSRQELQRRLEDIMLLLSDPAFPGVMWLTDISNRMWAPSDASWFELFQPLTSLLFGIGFLGFSRRPSSPPIFYMDDPLVMEQESNFEDSSVFYVHQTYRAGLDIRASSGGDVQQ
jgi:hypothetical protein